LRSNVLGVCQSQAFRACPSTNQGDPLKMPSAITGTPYLAASPTGYSGANNTLGQSIQTIWSKEILFQAMPVLRFEQFAVKKTELGVQPGLTINFMRYNNLGKAGQLTEGVRMVTNSMSASQFS